MPAPVRGRDAFAALARSRARGRAGGCRVSYVPHERVEVAYAIGRHVGSAVVRNRVRRRLRVLMAERADHGLPAGRYLIGAGPELVGLDFDELRSRLGRALDRALEAAT